MIDLARLLRARKNRTRSEATIMYFGIRERSESYSVVPEVIPDLMDGCKMISITTLIAMRRATHMEEMEPDVTVRL